MLINKSALYCNTLVIGFLAVMPVCAYAETIHLQLRWHHQFQFAGYYAALQQGYYKDAGLDVLIDEGSPEKIPVKEVFAGRAQYGVANSELILARLKGDPLVLLAAIYQHSPSVLLVRKDANVFSPSDLVGKKVMMINGTDIDADFAAMFSNEKVDTKRIHILPSSFNIDDLATGKVDAFNSYLSNEPFFLQQKNVAFTILRPSIYAADFYSDMLFTNENELLLHPERAKAFLNASVQGWHYALNHPEDIIKLLQDKYHVTKSKDHLDFEAKAIRPLILPDTLIAPDLVDIGSINHSRLNHMATVFVQANMISNEDLKGLDSNNLLQGFVYNDAKDNIQLKISILIVFLISCIAFVLYAANQSINRENKQRKLIANKLQQRTDELALHNHILKKINENTGLLDILNALAKEIEALHPEMICSILLRDDNNKLRQGAAPSLPDFFHQAIDGLNIAEGAGSCGTAAYRGETVIINDVQQHSACIPFRTLAEKVHIRSCWSQPIKNNQDDVIGVFTVYHTQPSTPNQTEISLIESYAGLAQLSIEQTHADAALLESEQRLRFVLKGSGLGFWDWKIDTHRVEINLSEIDVSCHHYALIKQTVPNWLNFVYLDDREKVWQSIRNVLDNKQSIHQLEYRVMDKSGAMRWILDRANIVQRDISGKPTRMSGTHTDITERKLAEQQLRTSEQRLTQCQHYGGIGTWEFDLVTKEQVLSSTSRKLFGFSSVANPKWENFLSVIHPEDNEVFMNVFTPAAFKQRKKYDVECRIINADQKIRWIRLVGRVDAVTDNGKPTYCRGIVQDITERKLAEEKIKQLAFHDYLTGLPNRWLLFERISHDINLAQREGKQLAVLMLDLDRFKAVNDTLGHGAGDELLQQVATRILSTLRKVDTAARLGGDEFIVLLPDITQHDDVTRVALAIIEQLQQTFELKVASTSVNIGTSIGISFYPQHSDNADVLLDYADKALYRAKQNGRGCFQYFTMDMADGPNT